MESGSEYFAPERVDEQIEHLQRDSSIDELSNEAQLVNALYRYYHAPVVAEDHIALERARQRVLGNHSTGETGDTGGILGAGNEGVTPLSSAGLVAHPRNTRLMRFLTGLAAVILVGTLVGSWFAVTHRVGTSLTVPPSPPRSLYVVQNGVAYRLAANSGAVVWQHRLVTSGQPDGANVQVVNGVVYVFLSLDIYALDARSGQQIWHDSITQAYFWFGVGNGRVFVLGSSGGRLTFSALNSANGSLAWHNTTFFTTQWFHTYVLDGNIYTVNDDGSTLYKLDGATGQYRWNQGLAQFSLTHAPLVANGVVYAAAENSVYALNEQTGDIIWKQTVPVPASVTVSPGGTISANVQTAYLAGGVLYVANYAVAPVPTTQQKFDDNNFFAYNAKTGRLLWAAEPGYGPPFTLPITSGLLIAPREYDGVYSIAGLNPRTGHVAWQTPFQCAVTHTPPQWGQVVYASCGTEWTAISNGTFYLLESDNPPTQNQIVYTFKSFNAHTGQMLSAFPVALGKNRLIVVGSSNGLLYVQSGVNVPANTFTPDSADYLFAAYRLSDGSLAWSHSEPLSPPPAGPDTQSYYSQVVLAP